jgi:hypothetical protein
MQCPECCGSGEICDGCKCPIQYCQCEEEEYEEDYFDEYSEQAKWKQEHESEADS